MIITLDIPNAQATRMGIAICALNGYNSAVDGTQIQFVKKWIIRKCKEETKTYERDIALRATESAANESVENGIVIT